MNKIKENWKSVVGFEGLYEVSDLGRVRSLNYLGNTGKAKVLSPWSCRGYLRLGLYKDGKKKQFLVHTLVITAFRGPIPAGMQVNHRNEDKRDNRLVNLEVVTAKQNINHGTRNERAAKAKSKEVKLTHTKSCGKYTFPSSYIASEFFGFKSKRQVGTLISHARQRGENWITLRGEKYYFA